MRGMSGEKSFEIKVDQLARVEGEGGVWVKVKDCLLYTSPSPRDRG